MDNRKLMLSENTLRRFCRLEITLTDVLSRVTSLQNYDIDCDEYYRMSLDDLEIAMNNLASKSMTVMEFVSGWLYPLFHNFGKFLCLTDLTPNFPNSLVMHRLRYLPMSDDEMMLWVLKQLYEAFDFPVVMMAASKSAADFFNAEELADSISDHHFNECMPLDKQTYSDSIKLDFIREWDNDLLLRDADGYIREMFKDFVLTLAENNNPDAIRILGYASYGGNSVFECDRELAAECMERLWKDFGFGYAANTLGYIHMNGYLSNGIPDYKNAFFYFSTGSAFGVVESACNMAEMFMNGHYVAKNPVMAESILSELYGKALIRFEDGSRDTHLADIAVRYGELQLMLGDTSEHPQLIIRATRCFIQAEYALRVESKAGGFFPDPNLSERIRKNLLKMDKHFVLYKSSHKAPYPAILEEFVIGRGYCNYSLEINEMKNNRFKIIVYRNRRGSEPEAEASLLTYFDFRCCELTDYIFFVAENVVNSDDLRKAKNIIFDSVENISNPDGTNSIIFFADGNKVLMIQASGYTVRKPKHID